MHRESRVQTAFSSGLRAEIIRLRRRDQLLMVAETQVKEELSKLLKTVDFSATSERQIRQQLCEKLGEDVLQLKDLIKVP